MNEKKSEDQKLFDRIAVKYSKKDIYSLSSKARRFQIGCLMDLVFETTGEQVFKNVLEIGCGSGANSK